jgi:asparagine synthase (glutamine-hydrolysing)
LAIIDPVGGAQPLANEDGSRQLVFNGEIYNFQELRRELVAAGPLFATRTDSEVLLHGYEEWGEDLVARLRGMFAFGLVDFANRRLFLARDQLGIKPLYWTVDRHRLAFASAIGTLRLLPDLDATLDWTALDQYLQLQYVPPPLTAFRAIRKLPPASCLSVDFEGTVRGPRRYWRLAYAPRRGLSSAAWEEGLDAALDDSIRAHLVSDVPSGAFLSGGVDSSLVVDRMSRLLGAPVKTFSIDFEDAAYSEAAYGRFVAEQCGTDHHVRTVRPEALAILPELLRGFGEPFGDSSAVAAWHLARMAREQVPMVLSGDGGDEAFGGYEAYALWLSGVDHRTTPWPQFSDDLGRYLSLVSYVNYPFRARLWREPYRWVLESPFAWHEAVFASLAGLPPLAQARLCDVAAYLHGDILAKVDVTSMAHGLEVRTPLVDVRVMELAFSMPEDLLMGRDAQGNWQGKRVLKKLLERSFPAAFVHRPKKGFALPLSTWFGPGGQYRPHLEARLLGPDSRLGPLFRPEPMERLLRAVSTGPLWVLLVLEQWLRLNDF